MAGRMAAAAAAEASETPGGAAELAGQCHRLAEELAQCKADKEFVWSLWKQLQKDSPDVTTAIDMAVTRERARCELKQTGLLALLHSREEELLCLQATIEDKSTEISLQSDRLGAVEGERVRLEEELEGARREVARQGSLTREAVMECGEWKDLVTQLETSKQQATTDKEALSLEVLSLHQNLQEQQQQQLVRRRTEAGRWEGEACTLKAELQELKASRDTWANHTTLQVAALDKLHTENAQLKADFVNKQKELTALTKLQQERQAHTTIITAALTSTPPPPPPPPLVGSTAEKPLRRVSVQATAAAHLLEAPDTSSQPANHADATLQVSTPAGAEAGSEGGGSCVVAAPGPQQQQQLLLESMERELFEAQAQLQAKVEEVSYMRSAHDRRLQRMQALQDSHRLALQQLKTYESESSKSVVRKMVNKLPPKSTPGKGLQQEGSEAVWNELAHCKQTAKHTKQQLLILEEERDFLKARCLRNQSTIAELRACLQHEKSDLERKICAIAEVESCLSSNPQDQKIVDLELHVEKLQKEKKRTIDQFRKAEKECCQLRQKVVVLQAEAMEREHADEVKRLEKMTKSTMTEYEPYTPTDSISVTDSAVQVEMDTLQMKEPVLKDAQSSPYCPWRPQLELSSIHSTELATDRQSCHHRTYSDGEILVHKVRAKHALEKMYDLSRTLQNKTQSSSQHQEHHASIESSAAGTDLSPEMSHFVKPGEANDDANCLPVKIQPVADQAVGINNAQQKPVKPVELSVKKAVGSSSTGPHKCVWQQQVKSLQQRLRTLTKQVAVLSGFKQSALADIGKERASAAQAKSETKEMASRMLTLKATIQNLQEEKLKLTESLKEVQSRQPSSSVETREALKKLEAEKKALGDKCQKLNETAKSVQEKLQEKTNELGYVVDRCAKLERDTKQKRQVIEDQRAKLKTFKEGAAVDGQKIHSLLNEAASMAEKVEQCKHKVELLRTQLKRQTAEKDKLMKMLDNCQQELANTIQQLSQYQETAERQKQLSARALQVFQRHSEQTQQEHSDTLTRLKGGLEEKDKVIQEFKTFSLTLAAEMERDVLGKSQQHSSVSSRVKEIAQSTLNLSELEIEEFFTDLDVNPTLNTATFALQIQSLLDCKPPFASRLVKKFMDFSRHEQE